MRPQRRPLKGRAAESLGETAGAGAVAAATGAESLAQGRPGERRRLEGTSAALLPESRRASRTLVGGRLEEGKGERDEAKPQ